MKKILFRKFIFDCSVFFLISLISASTIVWVFQAVNFLDLMVEDGRDFFLYLNYTLLNFPKIISKLYPFALFFSFFYVISKYELNNELMIYWNRAISSTNLSERAHIGSLAIFCCSSWCFLRDSNFSHSSTFVRLIYKKAMIFRHTFLLL